MQKFALPRSATLIAGLSALSLLLLAGCETPAPKIHNLVISDFIISDTKYSAGTYESGYTRWRPGESKSSFTIGEGNIAFFYMKVSNIVRGQFHTSQWKFYTPDNKLYWDSVKVARFMDSPVWTVWNFYKTLHLDYVQPGGWKVEFEFDERVVKQATFEILKP